MKIKTRINLVLSGAALVAMAAIGGVSYLGLKTEALATARREAELHLQAVDATRAYAADMLVPGLWDPDSQSDARLLAQVNRHYAGHAYAEVRLSGSVPPDPALQPVIDRLRSHPDETVLQVDDGASSARLTFVRSLRDTAPSAAGTPSLTGLQLVSMPMELPMHRALEAFWRQLAGMAALVVVLFLALNLMLRRLVVNPVDVHQRALRRLATQDSLTGATNRRGFMDRLLRAQSEAEAQAEPLSLVMVDLDHFKRINDEHGHGVGDVVLREVAHRMRRQIRRADLLGRLGGEEFAILLPDTDLVGARTQAEHLLTALRSQPFPTAGRVTASLGVAQWNGREAASSWLHRADLALYEAKHLGRDRLVVAEDLDTDLLSTRPDRLD
ncbi:GGDEF domain-containing protein [Sphaerotilus montanus]|uniref:diguanylate cyclase n=1 Tax=Sphaerotilus montanus TaxID=522889 RepID=A0A7Y9QZK0_9BURK|nr:GGDEF domain-containing protein [Sphaerotilus montanus]NYG32465.1 diguanylate cyclase (GGDEF)-like protein [Sphaerotilus montanus]NZD57667.1 GGDEF domain-containing protein [Sphaerotilus montanus]